MSDWQRKALALFPEHQASIELEEGALLELFWELCMRSTDAHRAGDAELLRRVHGFAEWCMRQGGDLWNQAAIGFYEDLLHMMEREWELVVPWLSPWVCDELHSTWALDPPSEPARSAEFREMMRGRKEHFYRTHVYFTGEIEQL